ncbi:Toll/interleukin-1 receptor domain-containing protein [Tanacetum coccineum]
MFPTIVRMEQLESLHISSCHKSLVFPEIQANMECLVYLDVSDIQIDALLLSIGEHCTNLIYLCLRCCFYLNSNEVKFDGLKCLKEFRGYKGPEKSPFPLPLVKLPELPSSIAIIIADGCDKLTSIGDLSENCKWLCYISLVESTVIDGNRLLQSMLKGNAIEHQSMLLRFRGLEIPKALQIVLLAGTMLVWGECFSGERYVTSVWYVSFASLRRTEWWNPTHKNVSFNIQHLGYSTSIGIGASLVPMNNGSGLTDTSTDSSEFTDDYTHKISISRDSKSSLTISPRIYE